MRKKPFLGQFGAKIIPRRRPSRSYRTPDGFSFRFLFQISSPSSLQKLRREFCAITIFCVWKKKTAFHCNMLYFSI